MKTRLLAFLLLIMAAAMHASAYDFMVNGLCYNFNDDGTSVTVTYQNSTQPYYSILSSSLTIPSSVTYNGKTYAVTSIGDQAFRQCFGLRSVTIPNSVTSIGEEAFYFSHGITSLTMGNSVTSIGRSCFNNCRSLTTISIPSSVTEIGYSAFYACESLTRVDITSLAAWCNINFLNDFANPLYWAKNLYLNGTKITHLSIPSTVTKIKANAFVCDICLTQVTIPSSVIEMGSNTFYNCTNLTRVNISDLTAWCNINFPNSTSNPLYYGKNLYLNSTKVTNLTIPSGVTSIKNYVFDGCTSITKVTIPNSVTSIGNYAFSGCTGMTQVTMGNAVNSVGSSAFNYCSGLTKVNISDVAAWCNIDFADNTSNPLNNAQNLYLNNSKITHLEIPEGVTKIKKYVFYKCSGLETAKIPNSVTEIGDCAFRLCGGLTKVNIPNSLTTIGYYTFRDCSSLLSISIPNSVTAIGTAPFENCTSLESVTIPGSVTKIENWAFNGCSNLNVAVSKISNPQDVTYTNSSTSNRIFSGIPATSTLYVPKGTTDKYLLEQYGDKPNPWLAFGNVLELIDGDVNIDGQITSADVTAIYNCLLYDDNSYIATCDINGDGNITAADVTAIYNMLLGE